ncbi:DUF2071 domain-containing protein [Spirosoma sp. RP8]|uniref:DUF2071 domain-containing protein n=1 Tax=Spirosoma liriopis TaxID=2937440 RepID=A0ABT0HSV8_9BACT|nr:DUF2071 domain-containing protein [Spirosoma liriopis]MCK8494600.1 DUF2071 domain-containing protein [Spirosoma liriopis]
MISLLKNHPFGVEAFFDYSLVLTYAFQKKDLQSLIPECLTLDTYLDRWAFVAVALVQTKALRPKGFPAFLGNDFFLIGYRIFVRYITPTGKRLRGLYILKSETDSKKMAFLGSLFTRYRFITTDIRQEWTGASLIIRSQKSQVDIAINTQFIDNSLPLQSPFTSWKEARRYAGPLPFTFSYDPSRRQVLIIEGLREQWQPTPVEVEQAQIPFIKSLSHHDGQLASAFLVSQLPYCWKPGQVQQWNR